MAVGRSQVTRPLPAPASNRVIRIAFKSEPSEHSERRFPQPALTAIIFPRQALFMTSFLHGFKGKQHPAPISRKYSYLSGSARYNEQMYRSSFHVNAGQGFV